MGLVIAYLTQGKVRIKIDAEPSRTLESNYGNTIQERAVRAQQRHSWKTQGGGFLGSGALWGKPAGEGAEPVIVTSISSGSNPGQVVYSLASGSLCALLSSDHLGAEERRLWNNNQHRLQHIHACSTTGNFAFSVIHQNLTANLGVMLQDDSGFMEVTEGDSVDTAPRWVPGEGRKLVYQSAGVGRNNQGHFIALGPFCIQMLDLDSSELEVLAEDPRFDYLAPRLLADGTLFYIRRPYERGIANPLRVARDCLLFPFRLLYAIFQFFNVFTTLFTGRKLNTSGGPRREVDMKQMLIWGNVVAAQQATESDEAPDLVPASWQLMRRRQHSDEEVLARGVLAYDLTEDGTLVYSNGSAIFVRSPDGRTERVVKERMIEQVAVLTSPFNPPPGR